MATGRPVFPDNGKSIGAFRGSPETLGHYGYGKCEFCSRPFRFDEVVRGLGSRNSTRESREREAKAAELSRICAQMFLDPISRCICDPEGDAIFISEQNEYRKREEEKKANRDREREERIALSEGRGEIPKRPAAQKPNDELVEQLRQLNELFKAGALTREQFEAAKNSLLGLTKE